MMDAIFNFRRAGLLIQRHFADKIKSELMYWGIMTVVLMFIRNNFTAIGILILVTGAFYASRFFREAHSATNRIHYFMLPATQLEKFVVSLFFIFVYFFGMMLIAYTIGNIVGTWANNLLAGLDPLLDFLNLHHQHIKWELFTLVDPSIFLDMQATNGFFTSFITFRSLDDGVSVLYFLIIGFVLSQSFCTLGGIYFKRNQLLKTSASLFLTGVFLIILFIVLMNYLVVKPFSDKSINDLDIASKMETLLFVCNAIAIIGRMLLVPILLLISYIRLTEKEV
jgi:hypothetical protein